jgi:hypothetical protein
MEGEPIPAFHRAARRYGGTFTRGGWFNGPSIALSVHGRPAVLGQQSSALDDSQSLWTRLDVDLRHVSPGTLKIYPEGFLTPIARLFGAQDLRIGDASFDALYVVKAAPASLAAAVFGGPRRPQLIAAVRAVGRYIGPVIDLSRDRLRVAVSQGASEVVLDRLMDAGRELTEAILGCGAGQAALWDVLVTAPGGRCPVCGMALEANLRRCGRCRTPHHGECWDYAGGCSTYACGEKRWN